MFPSCVCRDAAVVRSILDGPAAAYVWLAAVVLGVFGMYAVDGASVFLAVWAAGGLTAAVVSARTRPDP
jgi:hypothetical protein